MEVGGLENWKIYVNSAIDNIAVKEKKVEDELLQIKNLIEALFKMVNDDRYRLSEVERYIRDVQAPIDIEELYGEAKET